MVQKTAVSIIGVLGIIILVIGLFLYFTDTSPQDLSTCAKIQDSQVRHDCYMQIAVINGDDWDWMCNNAYLFSLDLSYTGYLNTGEVTDKIINDFKKNDRYLSNESTITIMPDGKTWVINDGLKSYIVKTYDMGKILNIYDNSPSQAEKDECYNQFAKSKAGLIGSKNETLSYIQIIMLIGVILVIVAIAAMFSGRSKGAEEDIAGVIRSMGWGIVIFGLIVLLIAVFGYLLYYIYVDEVPTKNIQNEYENFEYHTYIKGGYMYYSYTYTYEYYYISTKKLNAIALFGGLLLIVGAVLLWYSGHWLSGIYKRRSKRLSDESEDLGRKSDRTGTSLENVGTRVSEGDKSITGKLNDKEIIGRKLK